MEYNGRAMTSYDSSGHLSLGVNSATSVRIGRDGQTTTFLPGSVVDFSGNRVQGLKVPAPGVDGALQLSTGGTLGVDERLRFDSDTLIAPAVNVAGTLRAFKADVSALTASSATVEGKLAALSVSAADAHIAGKVAAGAVEAANGDAATPAFSFAGAPGSGVYYNAEAKSVALSSDGIERVVFSHKRGGLLTGATVPILRLAAGHGLRLEWTIEASDGVHSQSLTGCTRIAIAKAAAEPQHARRDSTATSAEEHTTPGGEATADEHATAGEGAHEKQNGVAHSSTTDILAATEGHLSAAWHAAFDEFGRLVVYLTPSSWGLAQLQKFAVTVQVHNSGTSGVISFL